MEGSSDFQALTPEGMEQRTICRFWSRIYALLFDSLCLGTVGGIAGLFCFDAFARMGNWGRLLGLVVGLIYFGVQNSALCSGQTLGKRLLKIAVVDRGGNFIPVGRSCLRYAILEIPFLLNGAYSIHLWTDLLMGMLLFGVGGGILYLYLFNRRSRQSLHDLAVGTYVVNAIPRGAVETPPIWKGHYIVLAVWLLVVVGGSWAPLGFVAKRGPFPALLKVQEAIISSGKVSQVAVAEGKNWKSVNGRSETAKVFSADVWWKGRPADYEASAKEIAVIILKEGRETFNDDQISVVISYGYNIGIASGWVRHNFSHSPAEWLQTPAQAPTGTAPAVTPNMAPDSSPDATPPQGEGKETTAPKL